MNRSLGFRAAYVTEKEVFFSTQDFNGLFRKGSDKENSEFLIQFPEEPSYQHILHRKVVLDGYKLIFFPFLGSNIAVYDVKNGEINCTKIEPDEKAVGYQAAFFYEDHYILIPWGLVGSFICFFPESKIVRCEDKLSSTVHSRLDNLEIPSCNFYGACFCKNTLYIAVYGTNKILSICMESYDTKEIYIEDHTINNMIILKEDIWITCTDSLEIVRISASGCETKYKLWSKIRCDIPWGFFVPFRDSLLLLPDQGEEIWIYNNTKDRWEIWLDLSSNPYVELHSKGFSLFQDYQYVGDELYLFPGYENNVGMLHITPATEAIEVIPIQMEGSFLQQRKKILEEEKREQIWNALFQGDVVMEDPKIGVDLQKMLLRVPMLETEKKLDGLFASISESNPNEIWESIK